MALTQDFKKTVQARVKSDPAFRAALLSEAVEAMLSGDIATGKIVLRDYISATVGFETLSVDVGIPAKSLMRMFGNSGNPRADNLFRVLAALQKSQGLQIAVSAAA